MIYHHLPEDEKWQLLRTPIKMAQYMQMPKLRPLYFEFKLEMIHPRNQCFVKLEKGKSFALVIMKAPTDVFLIADLKLHDQKIEGGDHVFFDKKKRLFYCYFAPANIGKHKITIYAKRGNTDVGSFSSALDLTLKIKEMPENPISYPKTWKCFDDFRLKLLYPSNTHLIKLNDGEKFVQILLRTPSDIVLMGQLKNLNDETVLCGDRVYYDRQKDFWRCKFAPDKNGIFDAMILAKKKTDPGNYTSAISFKLNANQISSSSFSFPKTWQVFYDLDLKIVSPVGRGIIVLRDKIPFADIHIKAPDDVTLMSQLTNDKDEEIPGGDQIYYDNKNDYWRCKFAPNAKGSFDGLILAKKKSNPGSYTSAVSFKIKAKQLGSQPVSLPKIEQLFRDLNLKIISPLNTNKIILSEKSSFAEICLKTPNDVELLGRLKDSDGTEIPDANEVYYDRHKDVWRCKFAPNHTGLFDAVIMAKKKSDEGLYSGVVTFQIEANHIRKPPVTFPKTWQRFYDFDLKIQAPRSRSTAVWKDNASYAEILIQAPDDIQLSCGIQYNKKTIENGALAQFDHDKQLWQLLFAPEQKGQHELIIYARRINDKNNSANSVAQFLLNVTSLGQRMKFPTVYTQFETSKCRIYTPLYGKLKKGSMVPFHCHIPDATSVSVTVDSKTLRSEGYDDPIFQQEITVGSEEVTINAKYGDSPHYTILIKYSVE
jgi:hypothetical protein